MATRLSKRRGLYQLQVTLPQTVEEAASALLQTRFAQWPVSFAKPGSDRTDLSVFLPADQHPTRPQLAHLTAELSALLGLDSPGCKPAIRLIRLADQDWKHSWKRHFKPIEIGRRLLLRPSWSRRKARTGQSVVVLDPGLSFGTGQHPTTSFCLRELVRARRRDQAQSFLDIGCGSGILAIAAAKLGYAPVDAFDHDPESVRVANANARRNRVQQQICFREADLRKLPARTREPSDVVCANLLADLLIQEAPRILHRVKRHGLLVIAGILCTEFQRVDQAYRSRGLRLLRTRVEGGWQSGAYRFLA